MKKMKFNTYAMVLLIMFSIYACKQEENKVEPISTVPATTVEKKMKVEIWSDIMCPFCYIGKRKFEMALEQFAHKDAIEIVWRSYQLIPDMQTQPDKNTHDLLAEAKGISIEEAKEMNENVASIGRKVGLKYNLDQSIAANTFNAHRLIHYAKTQNKANEAEERLFEAYFAEGKNIDDLTTLIELGAAIGLDKETVATVLQSKKYVDEVLADLQDAEQIGVDGVPFFLFNDKMAVSGAQEPEVFLQTLEKAFNEWKKANP